MQIAPGIQADEWLRLDLSKPDSLDWQQGISILERRIKGRFTNTLDALIAEDDSRPKQRRHGFLILAIDCMVLETLQAFREGLAETSGCSRKLCTSFLRTRPCFSSFFVGGLDERFYDDFRCGLVHNAQVFGTGKIWASGPLLRVDNGNMIVNRTAFHQALKKEVDDYLAELRDPAQTVLRDKFRTKMNFIGRRVRSLRGVTGGGPVASAESSQLPCAGVVEPNPHAIIDCADQNPGHYSCQVRLLQISR